MIIKKISSKGQLTLPKQLRKKLDLKKGDQVLLTRKESKVILRKIDAKALEELL